MMTDWNDSKEKAPAALTDWGNEIKIPKCIVTMKTQKLVNLAPQTQVCTPRTWDEPTALAQVNDYIRKPFAPVMQVIEKDTLADGRVRLLALFCHSMQRKNRIQGEPEV